MKEKIFFSAFIVLFISYGITFSQVENERNPDTEGEVTQEKLKTSITLNYYKNSDNTITLISTATSKKGKKIILLKDVIIHFYVKSIENNLGNIQSNNDGESIINLPEKYDLIKDSNGNIILIAKFDGDETYKSAEKEITVRDTRMEFSLSEIDSVKTIVVKVNEIIGNNEEIPLDEVDIYFYVQRLFGMLKIGEGWIEKGHSSIEFPNDLPGDSVGNVAIIAKIEDNDIYGNVEKKATIDWGIPVSYKVKQLGQFGGILQQSNNDISFVNSVFTWIISIITILILITIVIYKRS
jgi:hypothetical protein